MVNGPRSSKSVLGLFTGSQNLIREGKSSMELFDRRINVKVTYRIDHSVMRCVLRGYIICYFHRAQSYWERVIEVKIVVIEIITKVQGLGLVPRRYIYTSVQFSSVAQLFLTLCDPMNRLCSGSPTAVVKVSAGHILI